MTKARDGRDDAGRRAQPGGDDHHGDEIDRRPVEVPAAGALDEGDREGRDREDRGDQQPRAEQGAR